MSNPSDLAYLEGGPVDFDPSLFSILEKSLQRNPDGPAIIVAHQPATHLWELARNGKERPSEEFGCLSWSFSQIHRAACRLTAALHTRGVDFANTSTVCLLPNGVEWAAIFWAGKIMRTNVTTLDYTSLQRSRAPELQSMLSATKPGAIFVLDDAAATSADAALKAIGWTPKVKVMVSSESSRQGWTAILDLVEGVSSESTAMDRILQEAREDNSYRVDQIVFTSGTTTGKPKGCPRRARGMAKFTQQQSWCLPTDRYARSVLVANVYRVIAPVQTMNAWSAAGAIVMPSQTWDTTKFLEAIPRFQATNLIFMPALLHMVINHPAFKSTDTSSVTAVMLGGDMIVRDHYFKTARAFPTAMVLNAHGMTEGGCCITWPITEKAPADIPCYGEIITLGVVHTGAILKVVDDNGRVVKRGEFGELHFCNETFIPHYLDNVQPHLFYKDARGRPWFKSGDIGVVTDEGYIFVLGRSKDVIKRNGINVMPAALESCINTFCNTESSVIGMPHPILGSEPVAIVQNMGGKSEAEIKQSIIDSFGEDYALGGVRTLEDIGLPSFPLNQTGKIVKRDLIDLVQQKL